LRLLARSSARLGRDETALAIYSRRLDERTLEGEDHVLIGRLLDHQGKPDEAARAWKKALASSNISARALDELARVRLQRGQHEEAAQLAERLSRQPGWEAPGSLMLGSIRVALNDISGAAESFRRALELSPSEVDRSAEPTQLRKLIARTFLR